MKKRKIYPDEVEQFGPLRFSRYGRLVKQEALWNEEEHAQFKERLVERYPAVSKEIDDAISEIVEIIVRHKPLPLLNMTYGYMAVAHLNTKTEAGIGMEQITPAQLLLYIQNVVASNPPHKDQAERIEEGEYARLSELFEKMHSKIQGEYHMCDAAKRQKEGTFDEDTDEIRFTAQLFYNSVWGKQYQNLEPEILGKLLSPHDAVIRKHFGIGAQDFVEAIKQIQTSLTKGMIDAFASLDDFRKESLDKIDELIESGEAGDSSLQDLMQVVIKKQGWQSRIDKILGQAFGNDLFDLQKVTALPIELLEALSLTPGEDQKFMDKNEPYAGWPLKFYPSRFKPFLKIDGRYYCFHLSSLTDNIYRALYKVILSAEPSYGDEWQKRQGETVEEYAFELFAQLLPGAEAHQNIIYEWYPNRNEKKKKPCEADGIISFDDNLFIVEVRGGSFSPYSPTTDFEGFQGSISNLVGKPYTQGRRLLEYLEAHVNGAQLYDRDGNSIKEIRLSDYRCVTICCITLEQLTDLGGRLGDLKAIGTDIDIAKHPVWSVSIDDLRVYADLFQSPLVFCHYLEKRNEALTKLGNLAIFDELDHYGAYLEHNNYAMHFSEIPQFSKLQLHGYRNVIDTYYHSLLIEEPIPLPAQDIPPLIVQIIDVLNRQQKADRCRIVSYLLDMAGDARRDFAEQIIGGLTLQKKFGTHKIANLYGPVKITVSYEQDGVSLSTTPNIQDEALAFMLIANDDHRHLIQLKFTEGGEIYDVDYTLLTNVNITLGNEAKIKKIADMQANNRLQKRLKANRKIGRNEPCPCASGKKYKKCHGR